MGIRSALPLCLLLAAIGGCTSRAPLPAPAPARTILLSALSEPSRARDTLDLGRLHRGETALQEVTLYNDTPHTVALLGVETSCGCTTAQIGFEPLKAGEKRVLVLEFDTRGQQGWQWKSVALKTSLARQPYKIFLTAEVD